MNESMISMNERVNEWMYDNFIPRVPAMNEIMDEYMNERENKRKNE